MLKMKTECWSINYYNKNKWKLHTSFSWISGTIIQEYMTIMWWLQKKKKGGKRLWHGDMADFKWDMEFSLSSKRLVGLESKYGSRRNLGLQNHLSKWEVVLRVHSKSRSFDRTRRMESTEGCKADLGDSQVHCNCHSGSPGLQGHAF